MDNRIKELRELRGLTQSALGELVDAHWQTIQRIESGKTKLDTEWMERLGAALGVDPLELIVKRSPARIVEVRGTVQAGHWEEAWEWEEDDRYQIPVPDDDAFRGFQLYGVETRGPSMDKRYPEGTVVVVTDMIERGEDIQPGRRYVVERERPDGMREATVKMLWQDETGHLWLLPESTDPRFQEPIALNGDEGDTVRIVGRVVYAVTREP